MQHRRPHGVQHAAAVGLGERRHDRCCLIWLSRNGFRTKK
jgi:hypothetical protein